MTERIKITVRASGAHPDVLTVQDAMRQVLDYFDLIEAAPGVEWKLKHVTYSNPLTVEGEAVSFEPSVDVSVVARTQKINLARNLRALTRGHQPTDRAFKRSTAKRAFTRNMNGVGLTEIDFELDEPIRVTPAVAQTAINALDDKSAALFDIPSPREEVGSIEGTLQDVGTHYNSPAALVVESKSRAEVWCRLSEELQEQLHDKASYKDVWQHHRVLVRGRIRYNTEGGIAYVLASDMQRIEVREISLEALHDPNFTGGLSVGEYLDRFRDGTLDG